MREKKRARDRHEGEEGERARARDTHSAANESARSARERRVAKKSAWNKSMSGQLLSLLRIVRGTSAAQFLRAPHVVNVALTGWRWAFLYHSSWLDGSLNLEMRTKEPMKRGAANTSQKMHSCSWASVACGLKKKV